MASRGGTFMNGASEPVSHWATCLSSSQQETHARRFGGPPLSGVPEIFSAKQEMQLLSRITGKIFTPPPWNKKISVIIAQFTAASV